VHYELVEMMFAAEPPEKELEHCCTAVVVLHAVVVPALPETEPVDPFDVANAAEVEGRTQVPD
jgi:hypothetical protein